MYCSNCGAPLPENGICTNCGVPAQNMTYTGNFQGKPVMPQQQFYNPNPMYVQYQGSSMGVGQNYVQQENVAIKGIKDPRIVAGIGTVIKDCSGSMLMVMVALLTTVAMIFSYMEIVYITGNASYDMMDTVEVTNAIGVFMRCIPLTVFAIGAWMIVFNGHGTYAKKFYNDRACMSTAGYSTIQAGGIVLLIPTILFSVVMMFILFMIMLIGAASVFGTVDGLGADTMIVILYDIVAVVATVIVIIIASSLISQISKIKHAIRGRNYESISLLLPVLLFIMAALQMVSLVYSASEKEVFGVLLSGVYALWYAMIACSFLYLRSRINEFVSGR